MSKESDMNYAPKGKPNKVCNPGEFLFAAIGLDHGHIYGMYNGLIEADAELKWVYDPDKTKVEAFCKTYPSVIAAENEETILKDSEVKLVAGAPIPSECCSLGQPILDCLNRTENAMNQEHAFKAAELCEDTTLRCKT